ncbi:MAG TPA: hypothetical protein VF937_06405, partial [Chloroflexota bacterium]
MSPVVLDERVADQAPGVAPPTPPGGTSHLHLPIGQSITRGALALLSTQPLTWGASLLTATLVPRLLGAQLLGELAIVVTIASVGSTLAALGISEFLVRRFAQQPQALRRDAGIALFVQTGAACLTALSFALALHLPVISFANYPLLLVGLLPVLGAPLQTVLLSSFRGREKHGSYAWTNAISVALSSGGMVLVLIAGGGVVLATAVGGALGIMTSLVAWRLSGVRPLLPRP